jgi:hypothetical protein
MRHHGLRDLPHPEAFIPNPWVMGIVMIGVGPVLWWIASNIARDVGLGVAFWRRPCPPRDREGTLQRFVRRYILVAVRAGAAACSILGVAVLAAAAAA